MRGRTVRLLSALVAFFAAWLTLISSAEAALVPAVATHAYAYDGQAATTADTVATTERGPPTKYGSRGASARPDGPPRATTTCYTTHAHVARATRGLGGRSGLAHRDGQVPEAVMDATGKVHGPLPRPGDLAKFDRDALAILRDQLVESVQTRIAKTVQLGSDYGHNARIAQEQQLIHSIEKFLVN